MPPATPALRGSLATIEAAIEESRMAMAAEPNSTVAQSRLRAGLQWKVMLLQTIVATHYP